MKQSRVIVVCCLVVGMIVIGVVLTALLRNADENSVSASGFSVSINEIMASNSAYYDAQGNAYDWIELYNKSDRKISLSKYKLTDSERKVRYTFSSDASIPAKGYYVVWCKSNAVDGEYADFSISKAGGETIILMNSRSIIVDSVVTLPSDRDAAMARDSAGSWQLLAYGTPGYENTDSGYQTYVSAHQNAQCPVILNEIMISNKSFIDVNQKSSDWIELYNNSDAQVDLSGFRISDRADAQGYVFPVGSVIQAREYRLIYCDGAAADSYYAPFSLASSGGETIQFASGDTVLDQVTTQATQNDVSLVRDENGAWTISNQPTPGFENSQRGYEQYLSAAIDARADIRITELMASNVSCIQDADGDFSDWIELTNDGSEAVSLGGYFLSDETENPSKWTLPNITLESGERLVIFTSGKDRNTGGELHTNFSLNRHAGVIVLSSANGQLISSARYSELGDNIAFAADEATGEWSTTTYPTPGYANSDAGYEAFEAGQTVPAALVISEAMPGNISLLKQGRNGCFDWIELQNQSALPIALGQYTISDQMEKPIWCALPDKTLAPGECIVLLCTGDTPLDKPDYDQLALSLNSTMEQLYLKDKSGRVADSITLNRVPVGASCGRVAGQNGQFYFAQPTPGKANEGGYRLICAAPRASAEPGVYSNSASITISLSAEGEIYYTTDGNTPTIQSAKYVAPITITQTTVLRAAAVSAGKMMSAPVTLNYFLNTEHTLPIVAVTTDEANLYSIDNGILANRNLYDRSMECPANVSFFSDDGNFSVECGLKLHGAGSRGKLAKKSFKIVFGAKYGLEQLDFPLFGESGTGEFDSFLIRNSQDTSRTCLRDELLSKLAILSSKELLVQDTRFCVYYLNGAYQGIYCIKEAFSSGYFARRYGVSKDSVEVQRGYIEEGSEFQQLLQYAASHDLNQSECYQYIADRVNLESLIDWCVYEGYTANHDLSVNVRYYRSTEYDDNRWHYALFDMDYGFDGPATFDYILANEWHGCLLKNLLSNAEFCDLFLNRMAYLLEHSLTDENVMESFNSLKEQIRSEVPRNRLRWGLIGDFGWEEHIKTLEQYLTSGRIEQMKRSIAEAMNIPLSEVERYFGKENA